MLQNNQENASYRRSLAPSLDEQQAVIDEVAKGDATFNNVLTGMLNRFEEVTQFNKKHPTRAYGPIFMKNLEETISKMYILQDNYDSELRTQINTVEVG